MVIVSGKPKWYCKGLESGCRSLECGPQRLKGGALRSPGENYGNLIAEDVVGMRLAENRQKAAGCRVNA